MGWECVILLSLLVSGSDQFPLAALGQALICQLWKPVAFMPLFLPLQQAVCLLAPCYYPAVPGFFCSAALVITPVAVGLF